MSPTGYVHHPALEAHDTGPHHPERPGRVAAVHRRLQDGGLLAELDAEPAAPAPREALEAVHDPGYLDRARAACLSGARTLDSEDTWISPASWTAAELAAGGAVLACDRVMEGRWSNAFVACRPPGHHAERQLAMGFCLVNNVAVAAAHLLERHGLERVAILDWDVHHGNGTQHAFESEPRVLYVSLHQYPHYPGTGSERERGVGPGEGTTLNVPLRAGTGDAEWLAAFEQRALPALDDFRPELLLVSAGFDAHAADPLSGTRLSTAAFAEMTRGALALAQRHAGGRLVALLEGGYDLDALAACAEAHVAELRAARGPC